jgi:hypothetical protein
MIRCDAHGLDPAELLLSSPAACDMVDALELLASRSTLPPVTLTCAMAYAAAVTMLRVTNDVERITLARALAAILLRFAHDGHAQLPVRH